MTPIGGYGIQPGVPPPEGHARIRFRVNKSYGGKNFGPSFKQQVADVPEGWARHFASSGAAEYVRPSPPEVDLPHRGPEVLPAPAPRPSPPPARPEPRMIPSDFPGAAPLARADVTTFEGLAGIATFEQLTAVSGIGTVTAQAILEEMGRG